MWFVFALIAMVFGGIQSFAQRASVHRQYDTVLQSAVTALIASVVALVLLALYPQSLANIPTSFYWLGILGGIMYVLSSIARLEALKFVDSTIHFPLYKVVGPALVAGIGIGLLGDTVSLGEMVGIALSCLVPVLLITRSEHHRQKSLKLGVVFTVLATVLAATTAGLNAYILKSGANLVIPIVVITCFCGFIFALGMFLRRHKPREMVHELKRNMTTPFMVTATIVGISLSLSSYFYLLSVTGSDVSIAYSINAHYILIPVLLSVWLYKEHWNTQKAVALVVSILALILLHR